MRTQAGQLEEERNGAWALRICTEQPQSPNSLIQHEYEEDAAESVLSRTYPAAS